jgi:tetratricopeptide (TPR) repeat protein
VKLFRLLRPRIARRRELRRLRKKVFESPTPEGIRDLAHRLVWASETEEALRVVEDGVERFPESNSLKSFLATFKKNRLRETIDRLLQILDTRPLPEAYGQLADIYREVGELDQALDVCRRCRSKFPDSDIPYLIQGRIGADRFRRTLTVRDGRYAIDNLEKAAEIDPLGLKAHVHLAEILLAIGAARRARTHLAAVIKHTALDDRLDVLQSRIDAAAAADTGEEADVDTLLIQVETRQSLAHNPWEEVRREGSSADEGAAQIELQKRFGALKGSRGAALSVGDGSNSFEAQPLHSVLSQVATICDASARGMDLGSMNGVFLSGEFGHVVIRKVRGSTVAVHTEDEGVARALREPLQDFLVRHFG